MHRLVLIFIILNLSILTNGISQVDFKKVDSTSYSLYSQKDWVNLTDYGDNISSTGVDYYYFNLRIGIAHYNLEVYKKSIPYFEKALKNNSSSQIANEYLFWGYTMLNNELTAYTYYKNLEDSIQSKIDYKSKKIIETIFIEPGLKISNNKLNADNLLYANLGLTHKISPRFLVTQSYTNIQQKLSWGDLKQQEYFINPSYKINNKLKISVGLHYAKYISNLNYSWDYTYKNQPPQHFPGPGFIFKDSTMVMSYDIAGTYKQDALLSNISISKKFDALTVTPFLSFYIEWQTPNYNEQIFDSIRILELQGSYIIDEYISTTDDNRYLNTKSRFNQSYFGADFKFSFETISFGNTFIFTNKYNKLYTFFNPYLSIKLSDRLSIDAKYFKKDFNIVPLNNGEQLLNSRDNSKKTTITGNFSLNKRVNLYLTYQNEKIGDSLTKLEYKFNSIFIGLKIKL